MTLVEMLVTLCVVGLVLGLALPPIKRGFDRIQARAAAVEAVTSFAIARATAIARGRPVAVLLRDGDARISIVSRGDTLQSLVMGPRYGIQLESTRDSMAYDASGLGHGAANLRAIVRRGAVAETLVVSREGRVRLGTRRPP